MTKNNDNDNNNNSNNNIIIIIIIISIRESYYDRDSKDLHAGICTNPQKGAQCMNRMIDLSDWRSRSMVCARLMHKKNTSKDCDKRDNNNNNKNRVVQDPGNLSFCLEIICWAPCISQVQSMGSLIFFLEQILV